MKAIALAFLALCSGAPAELAPEALAAVAVVETARWHHCVHHLDAIAARAWLSEPGRFPDSAAVAAFLDPARPAPEGVPDLRIAFAATRNHAVPHTSRQLTLLARSLTGIPDISVHVETNAPTCYDHERHVVHLAPGADLPDLLHELGHAVCGVSDQALYEREFRDLPGVFQGASSPADTELWQGERDADAAFAAGILSGGRASRSYWTGIAATMAAGRRAAK